MKKAYENCQSCGMPIKRDENGGGTHKDGTKCNKYCSYCLVDGEFRCSEIDTAEKMQAFAKEKLKEMGFPGFIAGFFTKGIPKLERWKAGH